MTVHLSTKPRKHAGLKAKYVIYGIENTITQKWYIGTTRRSFQERKLQHLRDLRGNKHHSQKLQFSFNKHGVDAFQWHVLDFVSNEKKAKGKERRWIDLFNAKANGYNMTTGGEVYDDSLEESCSWNGIEYRSISEAARQLGISYFAMRYRVRRGYKSDADFVRFDTVQKSVLWNGVSYKSIAEAARNLGVNTKTITYRQSHGYTCDGDIRHPINHQVVWNEQVFENAKEAANILGINYKTLQYRLRQGYACEKDMKRKSSICQSKNL